MTTTTPDMLLILPDVSITAGPQWATLLNNAFSKIDAHDHSLNNGVQITPAGINISSDLSFGQNNATNLRSLRLFANNAFTPGASDRTCLYALNGELYYIDAAGNNVQLTINGTVDVANSITALSIKDSGFFIQYFGDTSRQFRFNASAIPTGTTRILSVPDSGANDTFVTQAATQTLTNKTIAAPSISLPAITTSANIAAVTAPVAPAAGTANIYVSSVDGQLHLQNSAGVDTAIGAGSSTGKNYLQSYYGFTLNPVTGAALNLTATGNRTTSQTVFGVSTAAASTLMTYNTASPLRAPGDLQITFPAAGSGAFVESPMFTLDNIDVNTTTQFVSFESSFLTSGAVAGDVTLQIVQYDASGNYVGTITPSITNIPTQYYKFKAAFAPTSTATAKYSLRFIVNTASARTLDIQDIVVGPQFVTTGAAVGAWQAYTPTLSASFGTATNVSLQYRRVGDTLEITGTFNVGTPTAAVGTIGLPSGLTIDTAKITSAGYKQRLGIYNRLPGSTNGVYTVGQAGVLLYNGSSTTSVQLSANTASQSAFSSADNLSSIIAAGDGVTLTATIPIAQWTTTVNLAGNANIEYASNSSSTDASDTTSFANGASGSQSFLGTNLTDKRSKRVRFQTAIQPTDRLVVELSDAAGTKWTPMIGNVTGTNISTIPALLTYLNTSASSYGVGVTPVAGSLTDVDVVFGANAAPVFNGSSSLSWSTLTSTTQRWRVAKYSAVGLAELAPITATSAGYVTAGFLPGIPSNTVATAGIVGEVISSSVTNANISTSYTALASITLTPGDWDISFNFVYNGSVNQSFFGININTTANTSTGTTTALNTSIGSVTTANNIGGASIPLYPVQVSTNTTYYANVAGAVAATGAGNVFIVARRRR